MRKSRRLASFLMWSTSKNEEVSQNCFVFNLTVRQTDRQADKQIDRSIDRYIDNCNYNYHYTTLHYTTATTTNTNILRYITPLITLHYTKNI